MTMDDRQIYIHIGMHKTGTTSLQRFLYNNHDALLRHGLHYPRLPETEYAYYQHVSKVLHLNEEPARFFDFINKSLQERPGASLLISSEYLDKVRHLQRRNVLLEQLSHLQATGRIIKIIVYLRRQDDFVQSLYQTSVRNPKSLSTKTFEEFLALHYPALNYFDMLEGLAKVFGADNLVVRIYEKTHLLNGSIIDDFLEIFDIRDLAGFKALPHYANRSYSAGVIEYIRQTNRYRNEADQLDLFRLLHAAIPEELLFKKPSEPYHYLSDRQRIDLLKDFAASNRRVAEKYLGRADGKLFSEYTPSGADDCTHDFSNQEMLAIQAKIQLYLYQQVDRQSPDGPGNAPGKAIARKIKSALKRLASP